MTLIRLMLFSKGILQRSSGTFLRHLKVIGTVVTILPSQQSS